MNITIRVTPQKIRLFIVAILVLWFFYMVPLNNGLSVPVPAAERAQYEQYDGENTLLQMRENPLYIIRETAVAIFHQFSIHWGGPIHQNWIWATMIITTSAFFWSSAICFISVPKGFRLKEGNVVDHMAFSAVLATVSLLQILQSLRSDPKCFFGVLWFAVVSAILTIRAFSRIRRCNRSIQDEFLFHLPWIIGLVVPHVIWFEPFATMNDGSPIMLPISQYYVNSYTIIMNLIVVFIAIGFIPQIKQMKERKS